MPRFTEEGGRRLALDDTDPLHRAGIGLAVVTGTPRLYLIEDWLPFLLAELGFFAAIALLALDVRRKDRSPAGVAYTLARVVGYLLLPLGVMWVVVLDGSVRVALVGVLGYRYWTAVMECGERSVTVTPEARSGFVPAHAPLPLPGTATGRYMNICTYIHIVTRRAENHRPAAASLARWKGLCHPLTYRHLWLPRQRRSA